jgi:hypothetical protein
MNKKPDKKKPEKKRKRERRWKGEFIKNRN